MLTYISINSVSLKFSSQNAQELKLGTCPKQLIYIKEVWNAQKKTNQDVHISKTRDLIKNYVKYTCMLQQNEVNGTELKIQLMRIYILN
jgi:hypothetical protein